MPELDVPELEAPEPDVLEPELDPVPELVEDEPEFFAAEPVDDEPLAGLVLWVEPGRPRASAPAVTTLATLTAVVAERTLRRPFCRSAIARRMPFGCALMSLILWSGFRGWLHAASR